MSRFATFSPERITRRRPMPCAALACGLALILPPAAFAQSGACVHLKAGAGYVARMRVNMASQSSQWSGNFTIGNTVCQSIEWVRVGEEFSVEVKAVAGKQQICTPQNIPRGPGSHSVTFFARGTTLNVKCEEPVVP